MPNRIIKESIVTSDSLACVSADAERLFWRLVVKADDFGLFYGSPRILASLCFPLEPPGEQKIRAWLEELAGQGILALYTADADGKPYLKLLSWDRHQQRRASKSKFPQPTSTEIHCGQGLAHVPVNENENDNGKREPTTKTCPGGAAFEAFWSAYPRKAGKRDALKAFGQLQPDRDTAAAIMAGVARWRTSGQWTRDGGRYIPYPASFLRGERWNDECPPAGSGAAPAAPCYDGEEDFLALLQKGDERP
ncbi:MAG: hypothetical protein GXX99_02600 [Clostridiales bacterium]|nr:hypothetical protein [Clostridiales bacterium]